MTVLPMWVIYDHPRDYPGDVVVRQWDVSPAGAVPTHRMSRHRSVEEARRAIRDLCPGAQWLARSPTDDPKIVESWF